MRYKVAVLAALLLMIPCLGAVSAAKAAVRKSPPAGTALQPSIPVYPKGKVTMEINLSNQDLLPLIQGTLFTAMHESAKAGPESTKPATEGTPSAVPNIGAMGIDEATVKELQAALAGLNKVSVVGYTVPSSVFPESVADFYVGKLALNKGWNKLFQGVMGKGLAIVYARPNAESVFGLMVSPQSVTVARTFGRIDIGAITRLVSRFITAGIRQPALSPEPPTAPDQTPAPEPAK